MGIEYIRRPKRRKGRRRRGLSKQEAEIRQATVETLETRIRRKALAIRSNVYDEVIEADKWR